MWRKREIANLINENTTMVKYITVTFPKILQPFHCDDIVRLGKDNDGGYLVNKQDIVKSKNLLSLGIGEDWSFETDFSSINDCSINAYDQSLNTSLLKSKGDLHIAYNKFFTGNRVHVEKNIGNKYNEIPFSTIATNPDTFLKCDIEGEEYNILDDLIIHTKLFTGMVLEFHGINKPENYSRLINFISKIDHKLLHVHVNNYFYYKTDNGCIPDILELSFTSSPNIRLAKEINMPNKLDMPNNPDGEEFKILFA